MNDDGEWPVDPEQQLERLPEDWIEETARGRKVKSSFRERLPTRLRLDAAGNITAGDDGVDAVFVPAPLQILLELRRDLQRIPVN